MPLKLPGQIVAGHRFGSALHCSINWPCSDAAPVFSPHRWAVLGVYVVVVAVWSAKWPVGAQILIRSRSTEFGIEVADEALLLE
jgi:hypothetical protein